MSACRVVVVAHQRRDLNWRAYADGTAAECDCGWRDVFATRDQAVAAGIAHVTNPTTKGDKRHV